MDTVTPGHKCLGCVKKSTMREQEGRETISLVPPRLLSPGSHFQIPLTSLIDGILSQVAFGHKETEHSRTLHICLFLNSSVFLSFFSIFVYLQAQVIYYVDQTQV